MFVNGIVFMTNLSIKIRLLTDEHITPPTAAQLSSYLTKIVNIYTRGGFTVRVILMSMEFERFHVIWNYIKVTQQRLEKVRPWSYQRNKNRHSITR